MKSILEVVLQTIDNITPKLGGMVSGWKNTLSGFGNSAMTGLFTGAGIAVATSAINTVTGAVDGLKTKLQEAAGMELTSITQAASIAKTMGRSLNEVRAAQEGVYGALELKAASLPGNTDDYIAIAGQISGVLADANKNDRGAFESDLTDIASRVGALAAAANADTGMSGSAIQRFLGGTSTMGELMQLDLFQKNADLTKNLRAEIQKAGFKPDKIKDATLQVRRDILKRALESSMGNDTLKAMGESVDGVIQGWNTQLFGRNGYFSILRRVAGKGKNNFGVDRNAFDAYGDLLKSLNGLFGQFSRLAKMAGFDFDPMAMLIDVLDFLRGLSQKTEKFLSGVKSFDLGSLDLGSIASGFLTQLRTTATGFIDRINFGAIGEFTGQMLVNGLRIGVGIVTNPSVWQSGLDLLGSALKAVLGFFGGLLKGIFGEFGKWIGDGLKSLGEWFIGLLKQALEAVKNAVAQFSPQNILGTAANAVTGNLPTEAAQPALAGLGTPTLPSQQSKNSTTNVSVNQTVNGTANAKETADLAMSQIGTAASKYGAKLINGK